MLVVVVVGAVDPELVSEFRLSEFQAATPPDQPMNVLRDANLDRGLVALAIKVRSSYVGVAERGAVTALATALADAVRPGDLVVTMGAGDVTRVGPLLLATHRSAAT